MPVYLFTYHAYGSWLPDRKRGYVKRGAGVVPPDSHMYRLYVDAMNDVPVELDDKCQRHSIAALLESEPLQKFDLYFVATDATHVHVLLGWRDARQASAMKALIKGSLTRAMNRAVGHRTWFAEGGCRKQVKSRGHFEYLITTYLPKHTGEKWSRDGGLQK